MDMISNPNNPIFPCLVVLYAIKGEVVLPFLVPQIHFQSRMGVKANGTKKKIYDLIPSSKFQKPYSNKTETCLINEILETLLRLDIRFPFDR